MKRKIEQKTQRPRLHVFRSNKHIYAQVLDDNKSKTIAASSSVCPKLKDSIASSATCQAAEIVGEDIAKKLKGRGVTEIIFDRGKRIYHGRIKAVAEATRRAGIKF
jgi:large subunit ribosomal protein L18